MAPALAHGGAFASGVADATVIYPLSVTQLADLDFGIVSSDSDRPGRVTIAPGGSVARYAGSAQPGCSSGYACPEAHAAQFDVVGQANSSYSIAAPSSINVPGLLIFQQNSEGLAGRAPRLVVSAITVRTESRPAAGATGQLGADGKDSFSLGGTLHIAGRLPPARYRISIPVVVTYN